MPRSGATRCSSSRGNMGEHYDAFLCFDETTALQPLHQEPAASEELDTGRTRSEQVGRRRA